MQYKGKTLSWNIKKDEFLKRKRGVGFEELMNKGVLIDDIEHPTRHDQRIMLLNYNGYPYSVPYDEWPSTIELRTLFPNSDYKHLI